MRPSMRSVHVTPSRRIENAPQSEIISLPTEPVRVEFKKKSDPFDLQGGILKQREMTFAKNPMAFPVKPLLDLDKNNLEIKPVDLSISNDPMAKVELKPPVDPYKTQGGVASLPELTISTDPMQLVDPPVKIDPYAASGGFAGQKQLIGKHIPMPPPDPTPYEDPAEKVIIEGAPIDVHVPRPPEMKFYGTWFSDYIRLPRLDITPKPITAPQMFSPASAMKSQNADVAEPVIRNDAKAVLSESKSKMNPVEDDGYDRMALDPTPRLFGVRV